MKKDQDNPTAIRLNGLKAPLQKEAMRIDRSLHWLIMKVLKKYVEELPKNKE